MHIGGRARGLGVLGETVRLIAGDGHGFDAYRAKPQTQPRFGLVVVQEIFGLNSHIRGLCDGFAADGILAVAPALFDRVEPGVELAYDGAGVTAGRALRGQIGWDAPLLDIEAAARIAATGGKVGVVGYCWGGSLAWLAAQRLSGSVDAAVGYYGGQIHDFIRSAPEIPVLLHFGTRDPMIPVTQVEAIRTAHPGVSVHTYPAGHGFSCDARADYHPDSAQTARARTLAFLDRNLAA